MSEPYIGQILAVGFNFAPQGWHICDGTLLPISDYEPLFNLIGTTYGGNGQTNFALPDLRGRTGIHMGTGPGLPTYVIGQVGGTESVTVNGSQTPGHTHTLLASSNTASTNTPSGSVALASVVGPSGAPTAYTTPIVAPTPKAVSMVPASIGPYLGQSVPHENRQPFLAINYIIALFGIYPSQG